MGMVSTEQTVAVIEAVGDAIDAAQPDVVATPDQPLWQVIAIVGTALASLLTAWAGYVAVKRRKKK